MAPAPDFLLLRGFDQVIAEIRMGDFDQGFSPLPGAPAFHVGDTIFSNDHVRSSSGIGDNSPGSEDRLDFRSQTAIFLLHCGGHTYEALSTLGLVCTFNEVQLSAGTAQMPGANALRTNLAVKVYLYAGIDGNEVIDLGYNERMIGVTYGV